MGWNMRSTSQPKSRQEAVVSGNGSFTGVPPVIPTEMEQALEERLGPLVVRLNEVEDAKIGLDARRLTGDEAMAFLACQGIHIGGRELG